MFFFIKICPRLLHHQPRAFIFTIMEEIRGRVAKVIFHNDENGFSVLVMEKVNSHGSFVMRCSVPDADEGAYLTAKGEWEETKKYGTQFVADSCVPSRPSTVNGIRNYLKSKYVKGIGEKFADMIVDKFGEDTMDILDFDPGRLKEIPGIGAKKIRSIQKSWQENREIREICLFLQSIGAGTAIATRIYDRYGKESIQTIKDNPYILADEVDGIGFLTADKIALNLGIKVTDSKRIRAGLMYALTQSTQNGDVYSPKDKLIADSVTLLNVDPSLIEIDLAALAQEGEIKADGSCMYLPKMYNAEVYTAERLLRLNKGKCKTVQLPKDFGKSEGITYDEIQLEAVRKAMDSKVMVLTGGPGTGKTTTTKGIISAWESARLDILLAAPTGRAAKRMSEATGRSASTIHRLLGVDRETHRFIHNRSCPLQGDALIVDEASMIDIVLMKSLLDAVPDRMRVVIVGDVDQLPSVGAGNVLRDIINSGVIPVVKLTRIFRQAMDSKIIVNAHRINEGKQPEYDNTAKSDFFVINEEDSSKVSYEIVDLVTKRLPKYYGVKPMDIQVLSPMKKSNNGVFALNSVLQQAINPEGDSIQRGGTTFRVGDKVMQMKNNYDKMVFNGDVGFVKSVDIEDDTLVVDFDGDDVEYARGDLSNLSLSYACTIHKSQGSEYGVVVMPMTTQFYMMLQRNLLYTGVTRAKKACVIIGSKKAISLAVRNKTIQKRNTRLKERLQGL